MWGDFDFSIQADVAHRPWSVPASPWLMTQSWHNVLFAHWPVDPALLRPLVPRALDLDLWDGKAWVSIVAFTMTNVTVRPVPPLPWLSAFPEVNVRTYVRLGDRVGVYFFTLDASRLPAVVGARQLFDLDYRHADIEVTTTTCNKVHCRCDRAGGGARLAVCYGASSDEALPLTGLDHFLAERYCLCDISRSGKPFVMDIHHRPWVLQPATAQFRSNTLVREVGIASSQPPVMVRFAKRQDVVVWPRRFVGATP